uniref:Uncharacterized protein n=1 Tax=viral metagenome TaxID=1070528 RepID=A0A6C0H1H3_9ZZZZ
MITTQVAAKPTMSEREQFVENVKKWVAIDTQLKTINERTKQIRDMKNNLQTNIHSYMENNNLLDKKIGVSDGELRFVERKEQTALSFGYIERCLQEIMPEKSHVDYIIQYLKDKRETSVVSEIRRTYSKPSSVAV